MQTQQQIIGHAPLSGSCRTLLELAKGQNARVRAIQATGALGRRLRDMGLLPGVILSVTGHAPLGCPVAVSLNGYDLSLRCEEAGQVLVDLLNQDSRS